MRAKSFDRFTLVNKREELYLYELNLQGEVPNIRPLISVKVSVSGEPGVAGMLQPAEVTTRTQRGDKIFVGYHQGIPVAYLFAATGECHIGEIDVWLDVKQGEVYFYDAFTRPAFRGRRIYPFLITKAAEYFRSELFAQAMIFSTRNNVSSSKAIERCGFKKYGTVHYHNLLGWKSWRVEVGERHVSSRLRVEA